MIQRGVVLYVPRPGAAAPPAASPSPHPLIVCFVGPCGRDTMVAARYSVSLYLRDWSQSRVTAWLNGFFNHKQGQNKTSLIRGLCVLLLHFCSFLPAFEGFTVSRRPATSGINLSLLFI